MGRVGFEYDGTLALADNLSEGNSTFAPIRYHDENGERRVDPGPGPYLVTWIVSPVLERYDVNYNLYQDPFIGQSVKKCLEEEIVIFGGFESAPEGNISSPNTKTAFFATLNSFSEENVVPYLGDPMARLFLPVYDSFGEDRKAVAVTIAIINWRRYFTKVLPETMQGITVVLENDCDGSFTYEVHGRDARAMGFGSRHNPDFESLDHTGVFDSSYTIQDGSKHGLAFRADSCPYRLHVYPSQVRHFQQAKEHYLLPVVSYLSIRISCRNFMTHTIRGHHLS
jgi:hypothetical protein